MKNLVSKTTGIVVRLSDTAAKNLISDVEQKDKWHYTSKSKAKRVKKIEKKLKRNARLVDFYFKKGFEMEQIQDSNETKYIKVLNSFVEIEGKGILSTGGGTLIKITV